MAKCMQCGGATKMKKMQKGGVSEIVGMPKYSNNPRSEQGRILKSGGTINRAVSPGCRGGQVKDASGKCVNERKFKVGGTTTNKKFAALAPPYNKATFADRIAGAKKKATKK